MLASKPSMHASEPSLRVPEADTAADQADATEDHSGSPALRGACSGRFATGSAQPMAFGGNVRVPAHLTTSRNPVSAQPVFRLSGVSLSRATIAGRS